MATDTVSHSYKALRLSRDADSLRHIRDQILRAVGLFLEELDRLRPEPKHPTFYRYEYLRGESYAAAAEIQRKPLEWFADKFDWKRPRDTAAHSAGYLLKQTGRIGR